MFLYLWVYKASLTHFWKIQIPKPRPTDSHSGGAGGAWDTVCLTRTPSMSRNVSGPGSWAEPSPHFCFIPSLGEGSSASLWICLNLNLPIGKTGLCDLLPWGMVRTELEDPWRPYRVLAQGWGTGASHLGSSSCPLAMCLGRAVNYSVLWFPL